jgi:hypothetical protein
LVTITADIVDLAVADFMMVLSQHRRTGQLTVENGEQRLKLAFRDGDIIYASSTGVRETVGSMLVRRGLINADQLDAALRLQKRQKGVALLGQILVEMGSVSAEDLNAIVYLQFQNVIREALTWTEGVGTFSAMDIPDLGEVRVDPREVILETGFRTERLLLAGAVKHDTSIRDAGQKDYFAAVRKLLDNLSEESLVVTSEMAAAILDNAKKLVRRGILFLVHNDTLGVVGGFDPDDRVGAVAMAGRLVNRVVGDDSAFEWVIGEGRSYRGRLKDGDGNLPLRELLGKPIRGEVIVVPVLVDGKVAAVLYGDQGREEGSIGHIGDLERVVARVAREMERTRRRGDA